MVDFVGAHDRHLETPLLVMDLRADDRRTRKFVGHFNEMLQCTGLRYRIRVDGISKTGTNLCHAQIDRRTKSDVFVVADNFDVG